jgi:hypothetical protein
MRYDFRRAKARPGIMMGFFDTTPCRVLRQMPHLLMRILQPFPARLIVDARKKKPASPNRPVYL